MKHRAAIYVRGAWAELRNAPAGTLEGCLSFKHPNPWYSKAFREKRWDGRVRLFKGDQFPAGHTPIVAAYLSELGRDVFISGFEDRKDVDLSELTRDYLPGIELWDHQWNAITSLLSHKRGVVKSPTGSGKTEDIFTVAAYLWEQRNWRSLVIEPTKGLMRQTYERACAYFHDWISVGMAGDGERVEGNVVIATGQTMQHWRTTRRKGRIRPADAWLRDLVKHYEVMFLDECHKASSDMWYDIAMNSGAHRRYGFSGTPIKDNVIDDMRLIGATGPIVFDVAATGLIERGLAARPKILMVMSDAVSGPSIDEDIELACEEQEAALRKKRRARGGKTPKPSKYRIAYRLGILENESHNRAVVRVAQWMVDHGRKTLLLCRYKEHYDILAELLEEQGTKFIGVWGATDNSDRAHAKKALGDGRVSLVLATGIWDEGEDIPGVNGLVFAEGVAATTNSRQRVGRGMRGDTEDVWVVDFVPTCNKTLIEHAAKRADAWEGEGYEVLVWEDWPEEGKELDLPFARWDDSCERSA
jgi:superfamily II DNA or RNA helicase